MKTFASMIMFAALSTGALPLWYMCHLPRDQPQKKSLRIQPMVTLLAFMGLTLQVAWIARKWWLKSVFHTPTTSNSHLPAHTTARG